MGTGTGSRICPHSGPNMSFKRTNEIRNRQKKRQLSPAQHNCTKEKKKMDAVMHSSRHGALVGE